MSSPGHAMRCAAVLLVLISALGAAAGCARSAEPPAAAPSAAAAATSPRADDTAPLIAGMHRYDELVHAMNGHALAAMFAADGAIANAGQVIATGPAEIERFLASFDGKVRVEATGSTVEHARIEGDRGFIDGRYAQDARLLAEGKVIHVSGRFTGEWVRDAAGAWWIHRLETTPDAPAP